MPQGGQAGGTLRVDELGEEKQRVVVIDGAFAHPQGMVDRAAALSYGERSKFYPGLRAPAPREYAMALAAQLTPIIQDVFGWGGDHVQPFESNFSVVTTPPEELVPFQRLPHFDGTEEGVLAVLHYLCDEKSGGTAFYRHKATGYESVNDQRYKHYTEALEKEVQGGAMPPQAYLNGPTPLFDQIGSYDCVYNRILVYRGVTLHSGNIPENFPFHGDPRKGRLTVNTFVRREAAA